MSFLFIVLLVLVQWVLGYCINSNIKHRFHTVDRRMSFLLQSSSPSSTPSPSSPSRFNINREKLLIDAQKLREEAESLEKIDDVTKYVSSNYSFTPNRNITQPKNGILSNLFKLFSGSKPNDDTTERISIVRDDFISKSVFANNTINAATINAASNATIDKFNSVLISRSEETKTKELLDKLIGIASIDTSAIISNEAETQEKALSVEDLKRLVQINYRILVDFPNDTYTTYICENNTNSNADLNKMKDDLYGTVSPWWLRQLARYTLPQVLSTSVCIPDDFSDDLKFLAETAFLLELSDLNRRLETLSLNDIDMLLKEIVELVNQKWKLRFYELLKDEGYLLDEIKDQELINFLKEKGSKSRTHSFPKLLDLDDDSIDNADELEGSMFRSDESVLNSTAVSDLMTLVSEEVKTVPRTSAQRLIGDYFDKQSRLNGLTISRDGAGRFQLEVLKDAFVVTGVSNHQGAFIFDGRPIEKDSTKFAEIIRNRFEECSMLAEVNYTIVMNELYTDLDRGIEEAVLEVMTGSSPAIIIYPNSWNTTCSSVVSDPGKLLLRNIVSYSTIVLSSIFASTLYENNAVAADEGVVLLGTVPIMIPIVSQAIEVVVAKAKGVNLSWILVPTTNLFTYGMRSTYLNKPNSRNDIFDIASLSIGSSLLFSTLALFVGLIFTVNAPQDVLATYPAVPYAFLQLDSLVSQLVSYELPNLSYVTDSNTLVHLHWLAVAGALSLLGTTFQLIPLDNSAGSKMTFASLGRENFSLLTVGLLLLKFGFIGVIILNFNSFFFSGVSAVTKEKLLFDYILVSQFCGDSSVCLHHS